MSAWFYVDTPTSWTGIATKGREWGVDWVGLWAAGSQDQAGWDWSGSPGKGGNLVGLNLITHSWDYGAVSFDGTNRFLYLNGSLNAGPSAGYYNKMNTTYTSVGNDRASTSANTFDGTIDEVRVSSVNRSAGWIATEYANQNSPSTFYSVGAEGASPCGTPTPTTLPTTTIPTTIPTPSPPWYTGCGWPYRKNITLNKTMVPSDQTDFTVLINLAADTDLKSHARADGYDILFTTNDGQTAIPFERES